MTKYFKSIKTTWINLLLLIIILISYSCSTEEKSTFKAEWPSITQETKPWTRWWWHGSAVNKSDLTTNMEELKNSGFGGVEITPIYGVKGYEKEDLSFLSKEWMEVFAHTLEEGQRLDLGIDLANASGWPFGGPWVSAEDACKNVHYKIYNLNEGEKLNDKIVFSQESLVRAVGHKVNIEDIKFPISSNDNLQDLALDQVRFEKNIPLQTLMAYDENGNDENLTKNVSEDGTLNWTAPKGEWKLYAVFQGWHGKMVERAGKGGEGNVIDHFSETATRNFLNVFDENAKDFKIEGLRAFFNDSYEVDDASGEANWTPLFFEEFQKLRGYDLKEFLPALFGNDDEEINNRVLCDYRETISDLLLNKFTNVWGEWSKKYNAGIRNQAHGSPANILDLYAASDIPETEGTSPMRIKMATSAGHVSGKPIIACEAATWLDEHFTYNLADLKKNIDNYFTNGVNHIVYHGTPYSPDSEEWPGWLFYASAHLAPTNTLWKDLKTINSYVTNCQTFLQNSKPANDILLYFPIYDSWSERGNSLLKHFGEKNEELTKKLSENLLKSGYSFDYISDTQIQKLKIEGSDILSNGVRYKTILIPKSKFIPLETMQKIIEMAEDGATVVFENNLPEDVPGNYNLKQRQELFEKLKHEIKFTSQDDSKIAKMGNGKILNGNNISDILAKANVFSESMVQSGLSVHKVFRNEGLCYFIINWSDATIDKWVTLNTSGKDAVWFNPMNRDLGKAKIKNMSENSSDVYLKLGKGETLILQWYPNTQDVQEYQFYESTETILNLDGEWEIEFLVGGPTLPNSYSSKELKSWTEHSKELKVFSGTASYKTTFSKPEFDAPTYELNLGNVLESAVVILNGEELVTLVGPEFKVKFDSSILKDENILEVHVTNLMANRIIDLETRNVNYKKFYNINFSARLRENYIDGLFTAKHWEPVESGLLGPVSLTPLKYKKY